MAEDSKQEKTMDKAELSLRILKEFGVPVAVCVVLMAGGWIIIREDRQYARDREEKHDMVEEKFQESLTTLNTQSIQALDKVGDATEDISEGLKEVKEQGEKVEEAFGALTRAIERSMDKPNE